MIDALPHKISQKRHPQDKKNSHKVKAMADFADVRKVTEKAVQVYKQYYARLDGSPESRRTLIDFFAPASPDNATPIMEWNGYRLFSPDDVNSYISSLPQTKHEVRCADAQPLPGCDDADNFFVSIHGSCTYDGEHLRKYFQRFVVHKRGGSHYIVNDYFRWTGEV